jgi:hypothetical protein
MDWTQLDERRAAIFGGDLLAIYLHEHHRAAVRLAFSR